LIAEIGKHDEDGEMRRTKRRERTRLRYDRASDVHELRILRIAMTIKMKDKHRE
jgi:hypothetical protein